MDFNNNNSSNNIKNKIQIKKKRFSSEEYSPVIKNKNVAVNKNKEFEVASRMYGSRKPQIQMNEEVFPFLKPKINVDLSLKLLKQAHDYEISSILMTKVEKCEHKSSNHSSPRITSSLKKDILSEITDYFQTSRRHMTEIEIFQFFKMVS